MTSETESRCNVTQTQATSFLSAQKASYFREKGYICPLNVLDRAESKAMLDVVRQDGRRLNALTRVKPHLLIQELWDLVADPRILDPLESILGPDIFCIGSSTIEKSPNSDDYVAWHQDATFWGMDKIKGATAWLALTPSTKLTGCVQVLPGSHAAQLKHHAPGDPQNMLGAREEVCDLPPLDGAVAMELDIGQMSLHHPLVLHGSDPNRSNQDRIGLAIRYFSAEAYQEGGSVTLVRGRNLSNMPLETGPDSSADKLTKHAAIVRKLASVIKREKAAHLNEGEPES